MNGPSRMLSSLSNYLKRPPIISTFLFLAACGSGSDNENSPEDRNIDIDPPVITLIGQDEVSVEFGSAYEELGANADDNFDDIVSVDIEGFVDTRKLGVYHVTYSAIDSAGNTSSINRRVNVVDLTPPFINLNGNSEITVLSGLEFIDPVTATDNVDGVVEIETTGNLDLNIAGKYSLIYTAYDSSGNQSTAVRTITVQKFKPFITKWKTDNPGVSEDNQITITTKTNNQRYTIDWGDGSKDTEVSGNITHTYNSAGTYLISITGDFKNISFPEINKDEELPVADNEKLLSVEQWGDVRWNTMEYAFRNCKNLTLNAFDTPNLSQVTSLKGMFFEADSFNQDINHWDVSSVNDLSELFFGADSFNQTLSEWDVSSVINMIGTFQNAIAFNRDISKWVVSSVTDFSYMFYNANSFNGQIAQWDTSSANNMSFMFYQADSFNQDLSQWNVSNVTNMSEMFYGAKNFRSDLSQWDVSLVSNMKNLFYEVTDFTSDLSRWNVALVTDMSGMFYKNLSFNSDLSQWDVSSVSDMSHMFHHAESFNSDISQWDTSSVTNTSRMFSSAKSFNADLSAWDLSNTTDTSGMFAGATIFDQNISQWDVSSVVNMNAMFAGARTFNQDIGLWDVSSVIDMSYMFYGATDFNQGIEQWITTSVTNMAFMFRDARSFNRDISQWDVSSVLNMNAMFTNAIVFNQEIGEWNVSSVYSMNNMFQFADSFNQDIGQWNVSSVSFMNDMLANTALSTENYDSLLKGWSSQNLRQQISFSAGNTQYSSAAESARSVLVNTYQWRLRDGGLVPAL